MNTNSLAKLRLRGVVASSKKFMERNIIPSSDEMLQESRRPGKNKRFSVIEMLRLEIFAGKDGTKNS